MEYNFLNTHITIENTLIEKGLSQTGGGGKIYSDSRVPCSNSTRKANTLRIKNSSFVENTAVQGGGLQVFIQKVCQNYQVEINSVTFSRNSARGQTEHNRTDKYVNSHVYGGNLVLTLISQREYSTGQNYITVQNKLYS